MDDYYARNLAAKKLRRVYEQAAGPRIRQYLEAEIAHALSFVRPGDRVLELGCGYGRVLMRLAGKAGWAAGVDNAVGSLALAAEWKPDNVGLAVMDAGALGFRDDVFDVVAVVQNGISAFKTEPGRLMQEAVRVTRPGGMCLFSSYAEIFWPYRLEWFRDQAAKGLLGEIDEEKTGNGVIVGKDGFRATTFGPGDFHRLADGLGLRHNVRLVDDSSVFCEIKKGDRHERDDS